MSWKAIQEWTSAKYSTIKMPRREQRAWCEAAINFKHNVSFFFFYCDSCESLKCLYFHFQTALRSRRHGCGCKFLHFYLLEVCTSVFKLSVKGGNISECSEVFSRTNTFSASSNMNTAAQHFSKPKPIVVDAVNTAANLRSLLLVY